MYKVYNFEKKEDKDYFESNYAQAIVKKAKKTTVIVGSREILYLDYLNEIISEIYDDYNKLLFCFPKNFEELLTLSSESLACIYYHYISDMSFFDYINSKLTKIKRKYRDIKTQEERISNEKEVFDYDFFSNTIASAIMNNDKKSLYINTCYYCNMTYINAYCIGKKKKQQFDLDHFIPKSRFSLFSLCLYNLVPSCQICNSRIKLAEEYHKDCAPNEIQKLMPTSDSYSYDKSLKFRIIPNKPLFDDDKPFCDFKDKKECFNIEFEHCDEYSDLYEKEAEGFDIIKRYDYHKREFLAHIDKARKYPPSYFLLLAQIKSPVDSSDLQEAIFDTKLRNDEKMIFQKIYNDIDDNL